MGGEHMLFPHIPENVTNYYHVLMLDEAIEALLLDGSQIEIRLRIDYQTLTAPAGGRFSVTASIVLDKFDKTIDVQHTNIALLTVT